MKPLDEITGTIIDESIRIHRRLGPGMLESVYEAVLARALSRRGVLVERQKIIQFEYDDMVFEGFRVDLVVEQQVLVELKSVETLAPVHFKKTLTYLKLSNKPIALLINFGAINLKDGLQRFVNRLDASASLSLRVNQRDVLPQTAAAARRNDFE